MDRAVLNQKEGAAFLGVSGHRFRALERAGYFKRLKDEGGGVAYLKADLARLWNDPQVAGTADRRAGTRIEDATGRGA